MACLLPQGAPSAAMTLEELIAFGVEEAICWGYCGSLQEDIGVGEVVLPSSAIREEGTSYHYLPEGTEASPDPQLQKRLSASLAGEGLGCHRGRIWTTDAPYRETGEKVRRYRQAGVLAVDMEMAALFAVAQVRGVALGSALLVSDHVSEERWTPGFRTEALKTARVRLMRAFMALSGASTVGQQGLEEPEIPGVEQA
jgi:uridine phosphorylase